MDLYLAISNGFVSSIIYDKRDDFDFDIVIFSFLDGDVPCRPSYGVYISQLIRFARVCSHVDDFNSCNKYLTAKLLKQDLSVQFRKIIMRYKRIDYNLNVMRQSACLVINPITVDGYAALFNCTPVARASDFMMVPT